MLKAQGAMLDTGFWMLDHSKSREPDRKAAQERRVRAKPWENIQHSTFNAKRRKPGAGLKVK
jgi:hypothetical protein